MFIAVLYALVLIQFTEGNIEELQRFLLSIQDCINRIEQSTAPENDRTWEYLGVFFLHLWQSLREQLHHIRERLADCHKISVVFPCSPRQSEGSSREEYGKTDYTEIREYKLEWNVDILQLTPFSGETHIQGALRACGIHIQRWKIRDAL